MAQNIDQLELPQWYDKNIITLLVVNPDTVYVYWELCFGQYKNIRGRQMVLHLYELPTGAENGYDRIMIRRICLPPFTEDCYIYDLCPTRCYQVELSWEQSGRYYGIIKSNSVELPPSAPNSSNREIVWRSPVGPVEPNVGRGGEIKETLKELLEGMSFYMGIK